MTYGPQLVDISNHQLTRQASLALGPKWSHVLRSSPGNKEALLVHAGQKRAFVVDSDKLEVPNKKYLVSQDDKEIQKFWQWLVPSPTKDYEYHVLELSWAWEAADSSRSWRYYSGTRYYS